MTNPPPPYGQPHGTPPKKSSRGLWIGLGIFVVVCVLGSVGLAVMDSGDDDDSAAPTTTFRPRVSTTLAAPRPTTATSVFSEAEINDAAYMFAINQRNIRYSSRAAIITLAHTVCDARETGNTEMSIALKIAEQGYSAEHAGYIVGAAESAYCPEFK